MALRAAFGVSLLFFFGALITSSSREAPSVCGADAEKPSGQVDFGPDDADQGPPAPAPSGDPEKRTVLGTMIPETVKRAPWGVSPRRLGRAPAVFGAIVAPRQDGEVPARLERLVAVSRCLSASMAVEAPSIVAHGPPTAPRAELRS